jgi:hypothetical protein
MIMTYSEAGVAWRGDNYGAIHNLNEAKVDSALSSRDAAPEKYAM